MGSDSNASHRAAASRSAPGTRERDALARAVLLVTLASLGACTLVLGVLCLVDIFEVENLRIVLAVDLAFALLFPVGLAAGWGAVAVALPLLFLAVASAVTCVAGLWSPAFVFFTVPVLLGFTLLREPAEWILLGASLLLYAGSSWVHGSRGVADLLSTIVPLAAVLSGLVLLLSFSRARLRGALAEAHASAADLAEEVRERSRAEEHMRDLAEKSRAVFRSVDDAVVLADLGGRIIDCNESASRLAGVSSPELLKGRLLGSFVVDAGGGGIEDAIRRIAEGQPMGVMRLRVRTEDSRQIDAEATAVPYRDAAGRPAGLACIVRDVTRRLVAEEELRHVHKMRAVERLTGGVAHEINNLLLAIRGYAELARAEAGPHPELRSYLDEVLGASDRAADLVARIASLGRSDRGTPRQLDLNDLLSRIWHRLVSDIGSRVEIKLLLAPDLRPVEADPRQIVEVIETLCRNAQEAMPEGGRITLETANVVVDSALASARPRTREGEWVCLKVSDTGTGMNPEVQEHLFEPFYTTKDHGKGTGLGLATAYEIIRSHHGLISVQSTVGRGSAFTIYLLPTSDQPEGSPDS